ncbi:FAD-binding protein [uncultured Mailhella sp.]|uniref:UDP-N-acetylmuramate dehydrogenase n=1 Tax=uncultured Mailhella sp. TaxID=1981031 RepID=UPI002601911D|nr:FAD-binding protein [uncultured Mailhella sp.]
MIIEDRPALAPLTTLRLGGRALAAVRLERLEELSRLPETLKRIGGSPHVLGGGSNLLIEDGELPIVVVRPLIGTGDKDEPQPLGRESEHCGTEGNLLFRVDAGMRVPHLLSWCVRHSLAGLEGLVGVPGRVGGAIAMNAGAYGCSVAPLLRSLTVFTPERGVHILRPDGWKSAYRRFCLKEDCSWFMILSAVLALHVSTPPALKSVFRENFRRKKANQPLREHTAGCVFKNPEGDSAGRLLDAAGMKGVRRGAFFFSPVHANFLVHDVRSGILGTSADALALIAEARQRVKERFGVTLDLEVRVWPCLS